MLAGRPRRTPSRLDTQDLRGHVNDRLKTLLLLVLSSGLALVAGEVGVRLLVPVDHNAYVLDDRTVYRFAPNTWTRFRRERSLGEDGFLIQSNGLGYRGPEPDLAPGRQRIAVYGDSFIHAGFSPLEETFVQRLEDALRGRGRDVQVLNAGTNGYGPDQASRRIEEELERIRPDLLVLAVYVGNDFGDLLRNKIYRLEEGTLVENDFVFHHKTRELFEAKARLFSGDGLLDRSALVRTLKRLYFSWREARARTPEDRPEQPESDALQQQLNARRREYRRYVLEGDNRVKITPDSYDADVALEPGSESARYRIALMEAVVERVRNLLAEHDVSLALLIIPAPTDVCDGHAGMQLVRFPEYTPSGPSDVLAGFARARGIPYLDLFPVYQGPECRSHYFRHPDNHWNGSGQALAAERMADLLADLLQAVPAIN